MDDQLLPADLPLHQPLATRVDSSEPVWEYLDPVRLHDPRTDISIPGQPTPTTEFDGEKKLTTIAPLSSHTVSLLKISSPSFPFPGTS